MTGTRAEFHFDFVFDFSDYKALSAATLRASPIRFVRRIALVYLILGGPVIAILPFLYPDTNMQGSPFFAGQVGLLGGILFIVLVNVVAGPAIMKRRFEKSASANRRLIFDLSESGFTLSTDTIRSEVEWSAITRLDCRDEHVFCFIDNRQAFVLARRGLAGANWPNLIAFIRERCPGRG